jgi:carbon-monoxide dehydrogenase small subunit
MTVTSNAEPQTDESAWALQFILNGHPLKKRVHPHDTLLETLRDHCRLTGTKGACHEGECGSCTVLVDGVPMNSCLILAPQAHGKAITTVEGLATGATLDRVQQAFLDCGAVQCGYCTPGLLIAAKAFLKSNPDPSRDDVRKGMEGNICRCTGYIKVLDAVMAAAALEAPDGNA